MSESVHGLGKGWETNLRRTLVKGQRSRGANMRSSKFDSYPCLNSKCRRGASIPSFITDRKRGGLLTRREKKRV